MTESLRQEKISYILARIPKARKGKKQEFISQLIYLLKLGCK
jgi:hypothetical protein